MWPSFKDLRQPIKLVLVSRRGAIYCVAQEALRNGRSEPEVSKLLRSGSAD